MALGIIVRRTLIFALLPVVSLGLYWHSTGKSDPFQRAEERLQERIERYMELRLADDHHEVYLMHDPEQRKLKSEAEYLTVFGTGIVTLAEIELVDYKIDFAMKTAKTDFMQTIVLQPELLPPPFNELDEESKKPEHLRQAGPLAIDWQWRDGDWYVRMDREFVTGRSADGRELQTFDQR